MLYKSMVTAFLVATVSSPALAALLTVNSGLFSFPTNVVNQTISLGQFDPTLGTLQQVDVTLTGILNSTLTVTPGPSPATGGYSVTWSKGPAPAGFYPLGDPNNTWGFRFEIADTGSLGLAAGSSVVNSGPITSAVGLTGSNTFTFGINDSQSYSLTSNLGSFIGTGLFGFAANANTFDSIGVSGAGSGTSQQLATALTGSLSATYTYVPTAVPLPAGLPLLACGLVPLAAMLRRRRAGPGEDSFA